MLNLSEIATSTEERVLTGVKVSQTFVIDGIKNAVAFADRVVPTTIGDRIEDQGQRDGQPGEIRVQPQHVVVVEEQEGTESAGLDAFGNLTDGVVDLDRSRKRRRRSC